MSNNKKDISSSYLINKIYIVAKFSLNSLHNIILPRPKNTLQEHQVARSLRSTKCTVYRIAF